MADHGPQRGASPLSLLISNVCGSYIRKLLLYDPWAPTFLVNFWGDMMIGPRLKTPGRGRGSRTAFCNENTVLSHPLPAPVEITCALC